MLSRQWEGYRRGDPVFATGNCYRHCNCSPRLGRWKFVIFDIWLAEIEAYSMSTDLLSARVTHAALENGGENLPAAKSYPGPRPSVGGIGAGWDGSGFDEYHVPT